MLPDVFVPAPASLMTLLAVFLAVVHGTVVPHVLRPGLRFPRTAGEADGGRDADAWFERLLGGPLTPIRTWRAPCTSMGT